ncbi:flavin reductase family protein [Flavobacteriaceae bacterium]|nr:flavin reductase family protein [Flavobacteriaceae bacterium]
MDPKKLREVAGCFPTGVTIVSCINPVGDIHGMTASSFLSVSLSPALVLFSVMNENQLAGYLKEGMPMGISILSEKMEAISNHFAKIKLLEQSPVFSIKAEAPVLEDSQGWYATKVEQLVPAGDHLLVICRVVDLAARTEETPLVYYKGYKKIAPS